MAGKYGKGDTGWFVKDRLGMFIHWGTYALAARHEWVKNRERITDEEYQKYFNHFSPDLYDPKEWARLAKQAGMKYFVVTTKHHEGFCLWDSKYTDYKATNTPWGKDLLRPMVDAFRAEGLKVGFYYSLLDWHHPEFPVDRRHPQRDDMEFREKTKDRDVRKYAEYMRNQVEELLTQFGTIDILWFDFSYPGEDGKGRDDWESEKLIELVRRLQPNVIVDNRLDLPGAADIITPDIPRFGGIQEGKKVAELCEQHYLSFAPHNICTPVGTVASAHLCACVPNFLALEHHGLDCPWWDDIAADWSGPVVDRGYITLPDRPGIGVDLNEDLLRTHLAAGAQWWD